MSGVVQILKRVDKKEIEVRRRFNLLRQIHSPEGAIIDLTEDAMVPLRIEVPQTDKGFVYLLVSLGDETLNICFFDETDEPLLTALGRHNTSSANSNTNRIDLRPWSVAAFVFNFTSDQTRIAFKNEITQITSSPLHYKTAIQYMKQLCTRTPYENTTFCCCARNS